VANTLGYAASFRMRTGRDLTTPKPDQEPIMMVAAAIEPDGRGCGLKCARRLRMDVIKLLTLRAE
jgi:hypothetical protein